MYLEHAPNPSLRPYLACYWSWQGARSNHRVLPDGCMDLLFVLGPKPAAYLVGNLTHWLEAPVTGTLLGLRFKPGGLRHFVTTPLDAFTNAQVNLEHAWQAPASQWLAALLALPSLGHQIAWLEAGLLQRLASAQPLDARLQRMLAWLPTAPAATTAATLADAASMSLRQLQRRFLAEVGVSPGMLLRTLRFQRVVQQLQCSQVVDMQALVVQAGYYDLPHLQHEFRSFAGITPLQWQVSIGGNAAN